MKRALCWYIGVGPRPWEPMGENSLPFLASIVNLVLKYASLWRCFEKNGLTEALFLGPYNSVLLTK